MFNYIHRIDGSTVNEVLINNQAFTEVGGGKYNITSKFSTVASKNQHM